MQGWEGEVREAKEREGKAGEGRRGQGGEGETSHTNSSLLPALLLSYSNIKCSIFYLIHV